MIKTYDVLVREALQFSTCVRYSFSPQQEHLYLFLNVRDTERVRPPESRPSFCLKLSRVSASIVIANPTAYSMS